MRKKPADTGKKTQKFIETQRANKKKHPKNKQNSTKQLKNNKTHVQTDAYTV